MYDSIIFLDIDGVLNCEYLYMKNKPQEKILDIEKELVEKLNIIVDFTKAKTVISSSWRIGRTLEQLQRILKAKGFQGEIIDKTERLGGIRGNEIKKYVEENQIDSYVIIDDDGDMLEDQLKHFVWVNGRFGLTFNDVFRAVHILNRCGRTMINQMEQNKFIKLNIN